MSRRDPSQLPALLNRGYRHALALTHDPAAAEDLVQAAWLAVLRADGPWTSAYLRRAIRSRFIDAGRRRHLIPVSAAAPPPIHVPPSDAVDRTALTRALGALAPAEREAIYLTAVEGYTAAEAGALIDKPRGTILSLVHRARAKLRRLLHPTAEVAQDG